MKLCSGVVLVSLLLLLALLISNSDAKRRRNRNRNNNVNATCPPPTLNENVLVSCIYHRGRHLPCRNESVPWGSIAVFVCQDSYIPSNNNGGTRQKTCTRDGIWSAEPGRSDLQCRRVRNNDLTSCPPLLSSSTGVTCPTIRGATSKMNSDSRLQFWTSLEAGKVIPKDVREQIPYDSYVDGDCSRWHSHGTLLRTKCADGRDNVHSPHLRFVCTPEGKWAQMKHAYHSNRIRDFACIHDCGSRHGHSDNYWPWHASIYSCDGVKCQSTAAGSLISSKVILTESGWNNDVNRQYKVAVGLASARKMVFLNESEGFLKNVALIKDFQKPDASLSNGMSAVVLESELMINDNISPICWRQGKLRHDNVIFESGGKLLGESRSSSALMTTPSMTIVENSNCGALNSSAVYCGHLERNNLEACKFKQGTGISVNYNGKWYIPGVLAAPVSGRCNTQEYFTFVKTQSYTSDIRKTLLEAHCPNIFPGSCNFDN